MTHGMDFLQGIDITNADTVEVIIPKMGEIAGRKFEVTYKEKQADGTMAKRVGLVTMTELGDRSKSLVKEAKKLAVTKESYDAIQKVSHFVRRVDDGEDSGILQYDREDGCLFKCLTELFCRLFNRSMSHKDFNQRLMSQLEQMLVPFAAIEQQCIPKTEAVKELLNVEKSKFEFTAAATKPCQIIIDTSVPFITEDRLNELLDTHSAVLDSIQIGHHGSPKDNILDGFRVGLSTLSGVAQQEFIDAFRFVLTEISKKPEDSQSKLLEQLGVAFASCRGTRNDAVKELAIKMLAQGFNVQSQLQAKIARYNMDALETMIRKNHPNCMTTTKSTEQFIHLKGAYLTLLADSLNLPGKEDAKFDHVVKKIQITRSQQELIQQHQAILQSRIDELCSDIASEVNNSNLASASSSSAGISIADSALGDVSGPKLWTWIAENVASMGGVLDDEFGLYDDSKRVYGLYGKIPAAVKEHKKQDCMYICPAEVKQLLSMFGFLRQV